ncbi:hypothetical protein RhiirC2_787380 [Rhizophagus irregularis]|uniref:F-box domain-containing protein n=1 Tax=Rhizophagus irregularis TaxID=588596 RepID=A0A2N1MS83_9GLOM|nr:hypothetical protein RhiirC2_787380 [Rhizophagus irregularis]
MTCSKLFSGDLPELLDKVIRYFHYDYKTLHSCILVNRFWCRIAILLLWEDPFSKKFPKNYRFIEIYLHYLNDNDKAKLNDYEIDYHLFSSNTLFNYSRFIQRLDTSKVRKSIEKWTKAVVKIFNNPDMIYFDLIIELILQNPNFINNIKSLTFYFDMVNNNIIKFIRFLDSTNYCNPISSLYLKFHNSTIKKISLQIIKSQKNIKKISFDCNGRFLDNLVLLSLKNTNCSNTLNSIIFYFVDFEKIDVLSEVFNYLNVLESIHIIYCDSIDYKFTQQINNIIKPFKLKSLFLDLMDENDELLEPLIEKSGDYLENLGFIYSKSRSQRLLQLIIKYCSKIKCLVPTWPNSQSIYLVFNLIELINQNLNYLFIDPFVISYNDSSSIILRNLGQILPVRLEYLDLILRINTNDLEIFLRNLQNNFIKKLLINGIKEEEGQDIFPYIKEFIVEKKRVKYLAIKETFHYEENDWFFQKDKVEEIELYDIQVLKYKDLFIDINDFIKETY